VAVSPPNGRGLGGVRHAAFNDRSGRGGIDRETAADAGDPVAHIRDPDAGNGEQQIEARAGVADREVQRAGVIPDADGHGR
jgi:hypothetical protein